MTDTLDIKITKTSQSKLAETELTDLPFGKVFTDHMFVADYIDGEWKNFEVLPYGPIPMSPAIVKPEGPTEMNMPGRRLSWGSFWVMRR